MESANSFETIDPSFLNKIFFIIFSKIFQIISFFFENAKSFFLFRLEHISNFIINTSFSKDLKIISRKNFLSIFHIEFCSAQLKVFYSFDNTNYILLIPNKLQQISE